ncbi:MAG: type II toxin-antitoxin system RelE/ParE family toxin [Byssovorax sp.]
MGRKRRIRWSRLADRDLEQDHAYLQAQQPEVAQNFAREIFAAVERLAESPEMAPIARDLHPLGRYRHVPVGRHRIIYRLDEQDLIILRVWDTRRDPALLVVEGSS